MESRTRNSLMFVTIVLAFALQCVSAEQVIETKTEIPAAVNPAAVNPAAVTPAAINPAAVNPAADTTTTVGVSPPTTTQSTNNYSAQLVEIQVYYEALCLDSVNFVSNELLPVYNKLSKFINVTFIPFAQGNYTVNPDQSLNLTCKREGECAADKVHACGIDKIKDSEKLIKFVNCSLTEAYKNSNKTVPIDVCGKNSNIDTDIITQITKCANTTESDLWLKDYKNKSSAANVTSVPKVFINKISTELHSLNIMMVSICKQIPKESSPEECKTFINGSDTLVAGVLPIIIGAFYFMKMV